MDNYPWLVKRRLDVHKKAHYSVQRVDVEKKLQNKLKKAGYRSNSRLGLQARRVRLLTADQDDRLFTIESAETDFTRIQAEVDKGLENKKVEKYEDLLVVKLEHDGSVVYGVRKISKFTRATKLKAVSYFIFEDKKLVDLEDKQIFSLDTYIDFFAYDGTTFITNKKEFESALNFRDGREKNRDSILNELVVLNVFSDVDAIRKVVDSNLHFSKERLLQGQELLGKTDQEKQGEGVEFED